MKRMKVKLNWKARMVRLAAAVLIVTSLLFPLAAVDTVHAASEPEVLFYESFQSGSADALTLTGAANSWQVKDDPDEPGNGILVQSTAGTEAIAIAGSAAWTDYTAEVRVKLMASRAYPGLYFRYTNAQNLYTFRLNPEQNKLELVKRTAGTETLLGSYEFTAAGGVWYTMKAVVKGSSIRCYMDNKRIFDVQDSSLASGQAGLRTKWGTLGVDDLKVSSLPQELPPPAALAAGDPKPDALSLTWSTVTDAVYYRVHRAPALSGPYQEIYRGASSAYEDSGLTPATAYYYKASAEASGMESADSDVLAAVTAASPLTAPEGLKQAEPFYARTVQLSWTAVPFAERYKIYRADSQEGSYGLRAETTVPSYTDVALAPDSTYYYKVSAVTGSGESKLSGPLAAVTRSYAPGDRPSEAELRANDYILYFVNAGDPTPATVEGTDKLGLYASLTEQAYGIDAGTGKSWGLDTASTGTQVSDAANKKGSLRYYNGQQVRDKAIAYRFELPEEDYYDVTFGFRNPWSDRGVNLVVEGKTVSAVDYAIGANGAEKEETFSRIYVYDGELNVAVRGPVSGTLSNYNDPLINYIIVRKNVLITLSNLQERIAAAKEKAAEPGNSAYSIGVLNAAIASAEDLAASIAAGGTDVAAAQADIRSRLEAIAQAEAGLGPVELYQSFKPGAVWNDTDGSLIQAHGGGILYDDITAKYYWYGEDKTYGYLPARGVRVYSSEDLYNWKDEGLALTAIASMEQFDTDPLISELYAGRTDRAEIKNDIGTDRIMERPKVIYNDKTKKYVMWLHTDGPSATSTANYAKAEAGYALSDSPIGPFVYGESHRMDRVPPGAAYDGQPNQPGMARDMTLFKDDDGTAYLIYSGEENMTIYISRLNEEYTDVTGWHKDGNKARDTVYKSEYGVDYIRVFPGAQREAPAMFKYNGKYYLITSGATGWAPNAARYTVAEHIFGEWKPMRDPSVGAKASTTFDSQSTNVIPVDAANGKFIFMGDRWVSSDLKNSRYIWLPVEFGSNDEIMLKWYDQWTLDILDSMGSVQVNTSLPSRVKVGELPVLPDTLNVTKADGTVLDTPVVWAVNSTSFQKPGTVKVEGKLTALGDKAVTAVIHVLPDNAVYLVHAGGAETADYLLWSSYMKDTLLNRGTADQPYDPAAGKSWGYVESATSPSGDSSGNMFSSLRYLKSSSGDDITYVFELENGTYTVYTGLYDPWYQYTKGSRKADILVNGATLTSGYTFTDAYDTLSYSHISVTDGRLEVKVRRSNSASPDPQISWLMVADEELGQKPAARLAGPDTVLPGQSFEVRYGIANVTSSVYAKEATIHYDPSVLTYSGAESLVEGFELVGTAEESGKVRILQAALGGGHSVTGTVELLSLRFTALETGTTVTGAVYAAGVRLADSQGNEAAIAGSSLYRVTVQPLPPVDKSALLEKLAEAQALLAGARIDSVKWGHYPQQAADAFTAAIEAAAGVAADPDAVQEEADQAAQLLQAAVALFQASRNTTAGIGDLALVGGGYGLTSGAPGWEELRMYDLNGDGRLDIADLAGIAKKILGQ
jgi:hypothetical protein